MTDITQLIEHIRRWQSADAAYLEARQELPNGVLSSSYTRAGAYAVDDAARVVTGQRHTDEALAAFVTLADEVERLRTESGSGINDILGRITLPIRSLPSAYRYAHQDEALERLTNYGVSRARASELVQAEMEINILSFDDAVWNVQARLSRGEE